MAQTLIYRFVIDIYYLFASKTHLPSHHLLRAELQLRRTELFQSFFSILHQLAQLLRNNDVVLGLGGAPPVVGLYADLLDGNQFLLLHLQER